MGALCGPAWWPLGFVLIIASTRTTPSLSLLHLPTRLSPPTPRRPTPLASLQVRAPRQHQAVDVLREGRDSILIGLLRGGRERCMGTRILESETVASGASATSILSRCVSRGRTGVGGLGGGGWAGRSISTQLVVFSLAPRAPTLPPPLPRSRPGTQSPVLSV